jgi:FkbH-like protein
LAEPFFPPVPPRELLVSVKLAEALNVLKTGSPDRPGFRVLLACGFTPLHLQTFLGAHLQQRLPAARVEAVTGLYGDLAGMLERADPAAQQAVAVALEWADLDARLGVRSLGGWQPEQVAAIERTVVESLARLRPALARFGGHCVVALSPPTLPLPPLFHTPGWQSSAAELRIRAAVTGLMAWAAEQGHIRVVNPGRLEQWSPAAARFEFKTELLGGLPYQIPHAEAVGRALALSIQPPAPKKGIITDLDDTLWYGIAGEIGAAAVSWDLASHRQIHGLYQQLLQSLAGQGILLAVASKNEVAVVEQAFARPDIHLKKDCVFPFEVHWKAKSGSVARILEKWNVGADSVVFIDDSPMELAEVQAAHPDIECLLFPKNDYAAAWRLFEELRDRCGKDRVREEDRLRLESLRRNADFQEAAGEAGAGADPVLAQAEAVVSFELTPAPGDGRILELVNKTNQFNLNGIRHTEADWRESLAAPGAFVVAIAYRDKFGPLGKISVIKGRAADGEIAIDAWVLSCRAFSRRIEHATLRMLAEQFGAAAYRFDYRPTAKNGPLREFFESIAGAAPAGAFRIARQQFDEHCPPLYQKVELLRD